LDEKAKISKNQTDDQLILFFRDFFKVILYLIGLLMILHYVFNENIGNLVTSLSIVGAAVALSMRESLENIIASFIKLDYAVRVFAPKAKHTLRYPTNKWLTP
jgi:MscS family membrane protein